MCLFDTVKGIPKLVGIDKEQKSKNWLWGILILKFKEMGRKTETKTSNMGPGEVNSK